ncbi:putative protein N(5)-glutamine methyltransferase [Streptomyces xiaopingdaonensis]|uniref:putative protein N(5)-glutamine methyltransferase n=1 Tax=Streptomyces xiaopingdaonensis TaxID=1565415 RepID=UPI0002E7CDB4|nr:putative protein N(5)-glutamine methyltransferase [Streptomyces xiaopingdaonensis]
MHSAPPLPPYDTTVRALRAAGCVFAEDEARLLHAAADSAAHLDRLVTDRAAGFPLEHLLGWAEFSGLRVTVRAGVFVPRRRTEFLVERAVEAAPEAACVVDLCCGTGALGAALARLRPAVQLHAADVDAEAVACARVNTAPFGGVVHGGDLFDALPAGLRGRIDVLLCNVPYVPTGELALLPGEARLHEDRRALDGGRDGLDVLRRVVAEAPQWLAPGGKLFSEAVERQIPAATAAARTAGLLPEVAHDEQREASVLIAARDAG